MGILLGLVAWQIAWWVAPQPAPAANQGTLSWWPTAAAPALSWWFPERAPFLAVWCRNRSAADVVHWSPQTGACRSMQSAMEDIVGAIKVSIAAAASSNKRFAISTPGGTQRSVPKLPGGGILATPPPGAQSATVPTVDLMESLMEAGFRSAISGMAGILDSKVKEQQLQLDKQQADMKRCHEIATAASLKADQAKRDLEILRCSTSEAVTNNASSVEALVAKVSELQAEMQRLHLSNVAAPPGLSAAPAGNSSRGSSSAERELPYEQRVHAVIGGLGWDSSGDDLLAKAKEVCSSIGLSELQLNSIVAIAGRNGGSTAELIFDTPALLTQARLKVRALNVSGLNGRKVFLDAKKVRRELPPARMTHRICEAFTEMAGNHGGDITKIAKNLAKKSVSYDGTDVGQTVGGSWKWLPASNQWPQDQLLLIKEWAIEEAA